jgi:SHS2 domain-containing protein
MASEPNERGHDFLDHTSELVLRLYATTFEGLIDEAARGFVELVPAHLHGRDEAEPLEVRIPSPDRAAGLVGWLNELIFLAEARCWIPAAVERVEEEPNGLRVRATGRRLTGPFVFVKAATLHGAVLRDEGPAGLYGEVTLDV